MTGVEQGAVIGVLMLALLALRVHIGIAMLAAGSIGYVWVSGLGPLLKYLQSGVYARYSVYDLSVVPLFLITRNGRVMGGLVNKPVTNVLMMIVTAIITTLNLYLLFDTISGLF